MDSDDVRNLSRDRNGPAAPTRVLLSFHPAAAHALNDLLTVGRGRPHGLPLSPVEAKLRATLRLGLAEVHG